jgi:cytoskeletal protein CcmA (bactofilin family)
MAEPTFQPHKGGTMWNKQTETESPRVSSEQSRGYAPVSSNPISTARPSAPMARNVACLGSTIEIKGTISGDEDLQIDGKVEGPISLPGRRLTVGPSGRVSSEVKAREVIVCGDVAGNLSAQDRVEIKKDASVIGDITAARISIEDGAQFKGRIEIDRGKQRGASDDFETVGAGISSDSN